MLIVAKAALVGFSPASCVQNQELMPPQSMTWLWELDEPKNGPIPVVCPVPLCHVSQHVVAFIASHQPHDGNVVCVATLIADEWRPFSLNVSSSHLLITAPVER